MGHVLSSNTVYAVAYLTDLGRKYLFDPVANNRFTADGQSGIIDAFKVVYFSMSDPDYNYNIDIGNAFETGDISNVSGKNDDCIKGTIMKEEDNLISVNGEVDGVNGVTPGNNTTDADGNYNLGTDAVDNVSTIIIDELPIIASSTTVTTPAVCPECPTTTTIVREDGDTTTTSTRS